MLDRQIPAWRSRRQTSASLRVVSSVTRPFEFLKQSINRHLLHTYLRLVQTCIIHCIKCSKVGQDLTHCIKRVQLENSLSYCVLHSPSEWAFTPHYCRQTGGWSEISWSILSIIYMTGKLSIVRLPRVVIYANRALATSSCWLRWDFLKNMKCFYRVRRSRQASSGLHHHSRQNAFLQKLRTMCLHVRFVSDVYSQRFHGNQHSVLKPVEYAIATYGSIRLGRCSGLRFRSGLVSTQR